MYSVKKISINDSAYPPQLLRLKNPPKSLYYKGPLLELLQTPRLAIVGSRKLSPYGMRITDQLSSAVARQHITIISGLALGADSKAHQAAITSGTPTIAVLPCGIEYVYPRVHMQLANAILAQGGALVSEYAGTTMPHKGSFIARNRIIAALAEATLIPEAGASSGSLHTAAYTAEVGTPILAAPGPITSTLSEGTNQLIKDGAHVITKASDILDLLNVTVAPQPSQKRIIDDTPEGQIVAALMSGAYDGAALLATTSLSSRDFQTAMTMLEIKGIIRRSGTTSWELIP